MATKKKTLSNKKSSTNNSRKSKTQPVNNSFRDEIILIATLALSIILILSSFQLCGSAGNKINGFVFGILGIIAYLLPYVLFFGVAFGISNRGNKTAKRKLISAISLFIVLAGIAQLIHKHYNSGTKILAYYTEASKEKSGGGLIGGLVSHFLSMFLGEIGAYVILIAALLILFMLITEKLLFAGISKRSSKTIASVREKRRLYREAQEDEYERDEAPRRKARVVTFPKTDKKKKTINQSMDEINADNLVDTPVPEVPVYEEELINKFHGSTYEEKDIIMSTDVEEIPFEPVIYNFDSTTESNSESLESKFSEPELDIKVNNESFTTNDNETIVERKTRTKSNKANELQEVTKDISDSISAQDTDTVKKIYQFPPLDLLSKPKVNAKGVSDVELKATAMKLQSTLESFGVGVTVTNISRGPAVTRYELQPEQGVKVSKITNLADDIKLNLAAADVRIEAPIPGKAAVGIEVPNKDNTAVMFRELIESQEFTTHSSDIAFAVGKDISGQTVVTDIARMPHLLIAGATGSGKSVCINTLIMSILYKANPDDVKLIMVDPKVVELSVYNGIPHLLIPVVTDPKKASGALNWAVMEMTERYKRFADLGVRDLKGFNDKVAKVADSGDERFKKMPQIVIIVDELADLMMVAPGEVEDAICRLAQMARAAGLHLIIATQRPSVNVITGLIKANVPSRIAFSVSSAIDSRTIIDGAGAEKLLGKGDMLFFPSGYPKPVRIQGAFVSDKEVSAVVEFLNTQNSEPQYNEEIANKIITNQISESAAVTTSDRDDYFVEAGKFIIEKDKASIGMLQRVYKIGFNRAARIMDQLCDAGVVGPEEGTKPRKVLMSMEEFENYVDEYV